MAGEVVVVAVATPTGRAYGAVKDPRRLRRPQRASGVAHEEQGPVVPHLPGPVTTAGRPERLGHLVPLVVTALIPYTALRVFEATLEADPLQVGAAARPLSRQ